MEKQYFIKLCRVLYIKYAFGYIWFSLERKHKRYSYLLKLKQLIRTTPPTALIFSSANLETNLALTMTELLVIYLTQNHCNREPRCRCDRRRSRWFAQVFFLFRITKVHTICPRISGPQKWFCCQEVSHTNLTEVTWWYLSKLVLWWCWPPALPLPGAF